MRRPVHCLSIAMSIMVAAAMSVSVPVMAQGKPSGESRGDALLDAVTRCRDVAEPTARLGCFDKAASALSDARSSDALAVLSKEDVTERRRSLFGFRLPSINLFGRSDTATEITSVDSVVQTVRRSARDRWTVSLADGSNWRTTELARVPPEVGDKTHIRRAALGSFLGTFAGGRAVRVERVE